MGAAKRENLNVKAKMRILTINVPQLEFDAMKKMIKEASCQAVSVSEFVRMAIKDQINYELGRNKMLTEYVHALEYVEDFQ
jgi:hypothetical protein